MALIVEHGKENSSHEDDQEQARIVYRSVSQWRSRGYLPHFDSTEHVQHVTFHLADSLPKESLALLETKLLSKPKDHWDEIRRRSIENLIDAGHGCCILRKPEIAAIVQHTILFFDGERYRVFEWVIMPNHVHVLFQPILDWSLTKIVNSWKKFTARRIRDYYKSLEFQRNNYPPLEDDTHQNNTLTVNVERKVEGIGILQPLWHREYWDRYIRNQKHFRLTSRYIQRNPVKARLVSQPEHWPWSSAWERHSPEWLPNNT